MAKKKETEPKGTDKKNEKINGEKTDNVEIEVEKEVSEAESLASQLKDVNDRLLRTLAEYDNFRKRSKRKRGGVQRFKGTCSGGAFTRDG